MHFDILVEDKSGQEMLNILLPMIIGEQHSYEIHSYKGIGHIPKNLKSGVDVNKRKLLYQLPRLLSGYGNTYANYPSNFQAVLIVICDLDNECLKSFRQELFSVLNACKPKPETRFCIAIEEGEAWLLGDIAAIKKAYHNAIDRILNSYQNDSICGTWEFLADAIYVGGAKKLKSQPWNVIGKIKSEWAQNIAPYINVDKNKSPSFCYFRDKIRELI